MGTNAHPSCLTTIAMINCISQPEPKQLFPHLAPCSWALKHSDEKSHQNLMCRSTVTNLVDVDILDTCNENGTLFLLFSKIHSTSLIMRKTSIKYTRKTSQKFKVL